MSVGTENSTADAQSRLLQSFPGFREGQLIGFVIPLIHPDAAKNWASVIARLLETVRSINGCYHAGGALGVLVVNKEADLPSLPECMNVIRVNMKPPQHSIFSGETEEGLRRRVIQLDKGIKVLHGSIYAKSLGADYIMTVDADDLVSRQIPLFVSRNHGKAGWYVNRGWVLPVGSRVAYLEDKFSEKCGTCHVIRTDLLELPSCADLLSKKRVRAWFGSHKYIRYDLSKAGNILEPFPFPAAVYRVAHGENSLGSRSVASEYFSFNSFRTKPLDFIGRLGRLKWFSGRDCGEFIFESQPE